MRLLHRLLDKTRHDDVTPQINILPQIKPTQRRIQPQLDGLLRLPGQAPADAPAIADVEPHGRVAVRLQALGDVVEGAGVGDLARHDAAGQVGDLVREGVPHALLLLGQGVRRRRDGVALDDERVEVDHLEVVVEEVEDGFAGEG